MTMRDAFFSQLFDYAKDDPNIVVLTSDFSAPSFDRFRTELSMQFINTGISEQNTILIATGLAHSGKNVFVTSIAPFITMRCFEQTRLYAGDMNLKIKIVAVGAGFSYNTAGPTHHSVEDIALMRTIPNMSIIMPSCNSQVEAYAKWCVTTQGPAYVRLDRMMIGELYNNDFVVESNGFRILKKSENVMIVSSGYMVHTAMLAAEALSESGIEVGVIDLFKLPADENALLSVLCESKQLVTVEEHIYAGGVGAYLCEILVDGSYNMPLKRFAMDFSKGFYHRYGTREEMHDACGVGMKHIVNFIHACER